MRNNFHLLLFGFLFFGLIVIAQAQDSTLLVPGKTITRRSKLSDLHTYELTLKAAQFIRVTVVQYEVDAIVNLITPDNKPAHSVNASRVFGTESLSWEVTTSGTYKLVIGLTTNTATSFYQVRLESKEAATAQDKQRLAAEPLLTEIGRTGPSALPLEQRMEKYHQALRIWRELGDKPSEAYTHSVMGAAYFAEEQYEYARQYFADSLTILRELKDREREALALLTIGAIITSTNRPENAVPYFDQALTIFQALKDRGAEACTYRCIGFVYGSLGRYEKAIEFHEKSQFLWRELQNQADEAGALIEIGSAYVNLSNALKAKEYIEQASVIFRSIKDRSGEAVALANIGLAYIDLSDYEKAIEYSEKALAMFRELNERINEGNVLDNLGRAYFERARYEKAIEYYEQALKILPPEDAYTRPYSLAYLGNAWRILGQVDKAIPYHLEGWQIAHEAKSYHNEAIVLNSLLLDWKAKNQPQLAIFFGKQSVNLLQTLRSGYRTLDRDSQLTFLLNNEQTYRELADLLIAQGRLPEAEQVIRMLKEEEFFEYVRRDVDNSPKGEKAALTPEEAAIEKRYREIADQLTVLGTQRSELLAKEVRSSDDEKLLARLEADLTVANQAFQKFLDGLAAEMAQRKGGDTQFVKVREAQGLMEDLRDLGKGTVALYTLVGENKFRVILTTPDVQKAYEVSIKGADLNRKVLAFRAVLQNPKLDPRPAAEELYKILFAPLAKDLEQMKAKTLMWSLDGVLRYVPIAALYDGKQYLVERFQHVMFTNESKARLKDEVSKNWRALGLGVTKSFGANIPALPAVAEEMRSIINDGASSKGVLPGTIKLDDQFTQESMLTSLRQRNQVVHVASHFQFQPGNEMDSALLLGDGKFLSLAQIKVMSTPFSGVELLTLSACNTATSGSGANGKEVEGFGMLAQRQGAKAVVASLWPVADRTTRLLMEEFYRGREAHKLTKGEALRHAQARLLRGELTKQASETMASREIKHDASATSAPPFTPDAKRPHAHPYYWAPFILIGNWK